MDMDKIVVLEGPDRVRTRPAVVFGSADLQGAQQAVWNILEIFATEAQLGYCKQLSVRQEGATVEIRGDDRGLYLGQASGEDAPWQAVFCEMFPLPACKGDESGCSLSLTDYDHNTLYGDTTPPEGIYYPEDAGCFALYCTQCASREMDVLVNRNGIHSRLHFEKGHNLGGITHTPTREANSTCFRFTPDDAVFTEVTIPDSFFMEQLENLAMVVPGLTCTYENARDKKTYHFPRGAQDAVKSELPVYRCYIRGKGRERYNLAEYEAFVELVVGYTPDAGGVKVLHNFRELPYGGSHLDVVKRWLPAVFNTTFDPEQEVTFGELSRHLSVILSSGCSKYCCAWENGTRQAIRNRVIADMTADLLDKQLENYLYAYKDQFAALVEKILGERKADC